MIIIFFMSVWLVEYNVYKYVGKNNFNYIFTMLFERS